MSDDEPSLWDRVAADMAAPVLHIGGTPDGYQLAYVVPRESLVIAPMEMRFTPPKQPELMRWITHSRLGGMVRPPGPAFRIVIDVDDLARDVSAFLDGVAKIGVLDEFKTLLEDVGRHLDDEKARRRRMKRARRKRIRARGWA